MKSLGKVSALTPPTSSVAVRKPGGAKPSTLGRTVGSYYQLSYD
jgi:hypothetical protein